MCTDGKILASWEAARELEKEQGFIINFNKDVKFGVTYDTLLYTVFCCTQ